MKTIAATGTGYRTTAGGRARVVALAVVVGFAGFARSQEFDRWNVRASLTWDGREADGFWGQSANDISPDGRYVTFYSIDGGFVPDDTNGSGDVFLRDRWLGTTERVTLTWEGEQSEGGGGYGSMSSDARFISFHSRAEDLVPENVQPNTLHVYLRDRRNSDTLLVSVSSSGDQGDDSSGSARMTPDGRYVSFVSAATNLVPGDTNGYADVFVRDLVAGETVRVSVATDGSQGDGDSGYSGIDISPDGRYVVFATEAGFDQADDNGGKDIYLHDRDADFDGVFDEPGAIRTERMSNLYPLEWNQGQALHPTVGALAQRVFYEGGEALGCDGNGTFDVYGNEVGEDAYWLLSHAWERGCTANGTSLGPTITDDERFVAFSSNATNLILDDTNGATDIFLVDLEMRWGDTRRISIGLGGAEPNSYSTDPLLTPNGCFVLFQSRASNLIEGDTNDKGDVFVAPTGICPAEDFNGDAVVDAADMTFFDLCLSGPADARPQRCVPADFDRDGHVDLRDFAALQTAVGGK